jgi:hypothetical protein
MKGLTAMHTPDGLVNPGYGGSFRSCRSRSWLVFWALLVSLNLAPAQSGIVSGLYEIVAGDYTSCCGIAGRLTVFLPSDSQSYVLLTVDPQTALASMNFLGSDRQTVFSIASCPPGGLIPFALNYGFCRSNSIIFLVDPGPPPNSLYWHYEVMDSTNTLLINGTLGLAVQQNCPDLPTQYGHSNVVAVLVPKPILRVTEYSKEGALLLLQGHAGWTNVVEASADLLSWTAICTNLMPTGGCPTCSFIAYRDTYSTNMACRFYRCFER